MSHSVVQQDLVGPYSDDERLEVHRFIPKNATELLESHWTEESLDALHITEVHTGHHSGVEFPNSQSSLCRGVLEPGPLVDKVLPFGATAFLEGFKVEAQVFEIYLAILRHDLHLLVIDLGETVALHDSTHELVAQSLGFYAITVDLQHAGDIGSELFALQFMHHPLLVGLHQLRLLLDHGFGFFGFLLFLLV